MTQMTQAAHILIVDDEPNLVDLLHDYLSREGYEVATAADGQAGLEMAHVFHPDLIVLDVMLPGMDGAEVCRQIRRFSDAYILMLTARTEEIDKIVGLSVGADDYVTKPFSPREVVARVKALLRRPRTSGGVMYLRSRAVRHSCALVPWRSMKAHIRSRVPETWLI